LPLSDESQSGMPKNGISKNRKMKKSIQRITFFIETLERFCGSLFSVCINPSSNKIKI
jgi:hypothetical protein